jgi:hypothetical protein
MPTGMRARAVFRELGSVVYRNNLGIAYNELPTKDRAANLQKAKVCLEAALRVYTESGFPEDYHAATANLAEMERQLRDLTLE